mmetsp:Transcript_31334/g.72711  ORF Transcript_31334/g.72711 Transcript_31334/m.72711 type:complete len:644 (-) Transcript_31334:34-1965(-)|eukprot:CAMPEP_0171097722 /NCGR_PEP_ID=MMETSP0766_2-20121228/47706_1 /TAXON_ID=439317 /ORGANISM="Gambierdiscus australes, Strain CAWD 149" /LENGTH=643 /DNA_ID=CAMNT_0011556961 /DNA_START=94 /DNA_END=2025 /DNA_ORIENTATION=+
MSRPYRGFRATVFAIFVLVESGHLLVHADLPIHCTQQDVVGEWTFQLGPPELLHGRIPACGHSTPNSVATMIKINRSEVLPIRDAKEFRVTLTEEIVEEPVRHLKANGSDGAVGAWTMVFDTGLEVRVGGRSLAAHFLFEELPNATRSARNGDSWKEIGKYHGRMTSPTTLEPKGKIYACHCDVTSTGWWHRRTTNGALEGGCIWGSKKGRAEPESDGLSEKPAPAAFVRLHLVEKRGQAAPTSLRAASGVGQLALHSSSQLWSGLDEAYAGNTVKEVISIRNATGRERGPPAGWEAGPKLRGVRPHGSGSIEQPLPTSFDWRTELASMVPVGEDPLGAQIDQGACGSCYAFAGIMMLQMRFRVKLFQQHKILYPLELSYKSVTRCSPYTEGCSGGFSYFISRAAQEVGVPLEECDKNTSASSLDDACDWRCYKDNPMLFYAKDYWHVGGFSHGSSEESIMREIYQNGPVELGFSTTAMPEFIILSGQSNYPDETDVMTVAVNKKAVKEQYSGNPDIHRWWYSTHAIICVGWGEDRVNWGMVKFWTVRNSWGRGWGQGGYAKMRRGNNDAGVETDASMVQPDMDRLPAGFLEKAKEYHDSMAAQYAERAEKAKSQNRFADSAQKGVRGIPEYCKQRPDSPDCH